MIDIDYPIYSNGTYTFTSYPDGGGMDMSVIIGMFFLCMGLSIIFVLINRIYQYWKGRQEGFEDE